jgi:hypothetical protein
MKMAFLNKKDFWAGMMLIGIGAAAMFIARDYRFGSALRMGPGFFPTILSGILIAFGVCIMAVGLKSGEKIQGGLSLRALIVLPLSLVLFGLLMEKYETPGKPSWLSFWFGSFAGIIPWIIIVIYVWSPGLDGPSPPTFVYAIIVSLFLFFNVFAVNMWLQYKQIGPWKDYLVGEKTYIILSLTAKALLAWQVFSAVLASSST